MAKGFADFEALKAGSKLHRFPEHFCSTDSSPPIFCYPEPRIDKKSVTHTRRLHLKTMPLILVSIILGPLGNVFLGKAMKGVGSLGLGNVFHLIPIASRLLTSGYIWLGVTCLLGFFLVHMLLLTWADYSYVQP